jgi:formylmethanofuran dehydrogenase subunit E-like metal-binding protein
MIAAILAFCFVVAVGSSDASVIKKDVTYENTLNFSAEIGSELLLVKVGAFDPLVPAGIEMPEMKLVYAEFKTADASLRRANAFRVRDRSPPNIRHIFG